MKQYVKLDSLPENVIPVTDLETRLTKWASINVHGKYSEQLRKPGTEKEATHTWMRRSDIFSETGGFFERQPNCLLQSNTTNKFIFVFQFSNTAGCPVQKRGDLCLSYRT
jgi:hypothetical protein